MGFLLHCLWLLLLIFAFPVHSGDFNSQETGSPQTSSGSEKVVAPSTRIYSIDGPPSEAFEGRIGQAPLQRPQFPEDHPEHDGFLMEWTLEVCNVPQNQWQKGFILRPLRRYMGEWYSAPAAQRSHRLNRSWMDIQTLGRLATAICPTPSRFGKHFAQFQIKSQGSAQSFCQVQTIQKFNAPPGPDRTWERSQRPWEDREYPYAAIASPSDAPTVACSGQYNHASTYAANWIYISRECLSECSTGRRKSSVGSVVACSVPGGQRTAPGCQSSHRQIRTRAQQACDQVDSLCHHLIGQSPETAERDQRSSTQAPEQLACPLDREHQDMGIAAGGLPEAQYGPPRSGAEGSCRHCHSEAGYPTVELTRGWDLISCWAGHNSPLRRGWCGRPDGCRGRPPQIATTGYFAVMCKLFGGSGTNPDRNPVNSIRRRTRRAGRFQETEKCRARRWCASLVILGSALTCPVTNALHDAKFPDQPGRWTDAYGSWTPHDCAACLSEAPNPLALLQYCHSINMDDCFVCPFRAVQKALRLRFSVLLDCWSEQKFALMSGMLSLKGQSVSDQRKPAPSSAFGFEPDSRLTYSYEARG